MHIVDFVGQSVQLKQNFHLFSVALETDTSEETLVSCGALHHHMSLVTTFDDVCMCV
jgi:hypothetical protein